MIVTQKRYNFGGDFTLSKVAIDGVAFIGCPYILEDKVREIPGVPVSEWKIKAATAIPVGRYPVKKTWSGRWQKMMWQIMDVPGFDGIRPHAGNTSNHTEGCPLCGKERDEKHGEVSGSRVARDALYARFDAAEKRLEDIFWVVDGLPEA